MAPLYWIIEENRQPRVLRQRAKPFAILVDYAADVPVWLFERDHCDSGIGVCAGSNHVIEGGRLSGLP
jgi:hypothetical protein